MARKTVAQWIQEALHDRDKTAPCKRFTLVHMKAGAGESEVHTTRLADGRQWTSEELGKMFTGKAEVYCQDMSGVQSFNLKAYYGDSNEPEASFLFLRNPSPDAFQSGLATEAPDQVGRLAQMMRQGEMLFQQTYRRQQQLDDYTLRIIEVTSQDNHKLRVENADAFNLVKELLIEKEQKGHEFKMKELEFERSTFERKTLMKMIPALMNTITGRDVFPESTQDTALIETIADCLDEQDIPKLMGFVKDPKLAGPLFDRFTQIYKKRREDKEEAKRTAMTLSSDPEADAGGKPYGNGSVQ